MGSDPDRIHFDIPGSDPGFNSADGTFTIQPQSPLASWAPVVIDGFTQLGAQDTSLKIQLSGNLAGRAPGLQINTSDSTVRGLVINQFRGAGIQLGSGGDNTISSNFIGSDFQGTCTLGSRWLPVRATEFLGIQSHPMVLSALTSERTM